VNQKREEHLGIDVNQQLKWKLPSAKLQNFLPHNPTMEKMTRRSTTKKNNKNCN
jgi:hypothetical protein